VWVITNNPAQPKLAPVVNNIPNITTLPLASAGIAPVTENTTAPVFVP